MCLFRVSINKSEVITQSTGSNAVARWGIWFLPGVALW